MATKIEQYSYADKVAALTHQYLELGLPLNSALRAAEADLWEPETRVWLFKAVLPPRSDVTRFGKTSSRLLRYQPVVCRTPGPAAVCRAATRQFSETGDA